MVGAASLGLQDGGGEERYWCIVFHIAFTQLALPLGEAKLISQTLLPEMQPCSTDTPHSKFTLLLIGSPLVCNPDQKLHVLDLKLLSEVQYRGVSHTMKTDKSYPVQSDFGGKVAEKGQRQECQPGPISPAIFPDTLCHCFWQPRKAKWSCAEHAYLIVIYYQLST